MRMVASIIALCLAVCACGDKDKNDQAALRRFAKDADLAVRLNPVAASKDHGLVFEGIAGPRFRITDASATEIGELHWSMTEVVPRTAYQFTLDVEKAPAPTESVLRIEVFGGGTRTAVFDCGFDARSGEARPAESETAETIVDQGAFWRVTCAVATAAATDTIFVTLIPAAKEPAGQGEIVFRRLAFNRRPL